MTGDSCTRLAVKLLTNLALGRGAFLAWDTVSAGCSRPLHLRVKSGGVSHLGGRAVGAHAAHPQGLSDERHGDVVVVRPMRDHTLKEVAFYNRLFAVPSVFTPAIDTKVSSRVPGHLPSVDPQVLTAAVASDYTV